MMRILVAGGAGFIGSHLCAQLLRDGHLVYCFDRPSAANLANIAGLRPWPRFSFVPRSVGDPLRVPVDAIYDLQPPAGAPQAAQDADDTGELMEQAARNGSHYAHVSPQSLFTAPADPNAEEAPQHLVRRRQQAEAACARLSTRTPVSLLDVIDVYGPQMRATDGPGLFTLLTRAMRGEPLEVYGETIAAPCFVSDAAEGLSRVLAKYAGLARRVIIAGPAVDAADLAERARQAAGSAAPIERRPAPLALRDARRPQAGRARELLGWLPQTPLAQGLQRTLASFTQMSDLPDQRLSPRSAPAVV